MRAVMSLAGIVVFALVAALALGMDGGGGGRCAGALLVTQGVKAPVGLGLDARGILYVAEADGRVLCVTSGDEPRVLARGLGRLGGLAVDGGAAVYVSRPEAGEVLRIGPRGGIVPVAVGLDEPCGLHVDAGGRLYVVEGGAGRVVRLGPDGARETLPCGVASPWAVAESGGVVLVSGRGGVCPVGAPGGAVWADEGGTGFLLASGPSGLAWALDKDADCLLRVAGGGGGCRLPAEVGPVACMACDRDGNVLAAAEDGRIWLVRPGGGSNGG